MKNMIRHCFAFLMAVSLFIGALPIIASAADNELVLTKVGHTHSDTINITNPATRSVTLTVPFSFTGNTLDLSAGLIVDKASSIDSVITSFSAGSAASIGESGTAGAPVSMTVTYYKGGNTSNQHTTVYSISVIRAARNAPTFTGTITKSVNGLMPGSKTNDITFTSGDFSKLYTANDGGALTNITITGSSLSCGSLKLGSGTTYVNYESGKLIGINDIGNLVFDAAGSGTVSYIVSAYAGTDTSAAIGSVLLTITVSTIAVPTISGTLSKSVNAGSACSFSLADFNSLYNLHNGTLNTIEIMPASTDVGVWSSGTTAFTGAASFTSSTIGTLKFTGSAGGTAAFTWRVSNEAGFSESGSGLVTVKTTSVPTITSAVVKAVNYGATLTFSLNDFSSCCSLNNGTLHKIVITPANNAYGTWYKGSNAFTGTKTFDSNDISTLKFKGTLCGQAGFTWTVSNEKGTSAAGNGYITINAVGTTINYSTSLNTEKTFTAADFNNACKDATGANLNYILFSLPSVTFGTLYSDYASASNPGTAITASAVIFSNTSPKISNVTFVPATNYSGTFTISYTGVNVNGISYTGSIRIIVGNAADVSYYTPQNTVRTFNASDFNNVCANITGNSLSYVYFSLPSSAYGILYYGYSSPSNPGTSVTPNSPYSIQNLSYITFVPAANYTGVLSIPYTGVAANSAAFSGYIKISVGSASVSYTTIKNTAKVFSAADFNAACQGATGTALSYIVLTTPLPDNGTLYYNDPSASAPVIPITAGTSFYASSAPNISYVTFVPAAGYTGTSTISYVGYSVTGSAYTGTVLIQVKTKTGSAYFSDVGSSYDWAAGAIDYLYEYGIVKGTGSKKFSPGADMTRGDFMVMLCNAMGFSGNSKNNFSDVPKGSYYYNAIAAAKALGLAMGYNNKFSPNSPLTRQDAMVFIDRALTISGLTLAPGSNGDISAFADRGNISSYASKAVQTLVKAGLIKGSNNKLNPAGVLSRAEMAAILYRVKITYS